MSAAEKTRIAILASGRGSGFAAIAAAIQEGRLDAEIVCAVTDQPGAGVIGQGRKAGVPVLELPPAKWEGQTSEQRRKAHEIALLEALKKHAPHFLVMAGYMRIITPHLLEAFRSERGYSRIVNVHPSLLPAFPGVAGYEQAFNHGVRVAGVTVHLVEHDLDSGPICAQESFSIADCRSAEEVEKRGLAVEHRLYPETLQWVLAENFVMESRASGAVTAQRDALGGAPLGGAPGTRRLCVRKN